MRWIQRGFDFYINASIHVALAVVSLVLITADQWNLQLPWELLIFVFFGSVSGYNFVKYAKIAGMYHRSLTRSLRAIQIFSFLALIPVIYTGLLLPRAVIWGTLFFGLFTLFYAVPLPGMHNLRSLAAIKIFIVAWVWAGVTVYLPWVMEPTEMTVPWVVTFLSRFAFVFALTLPFEIRDLRFDDRALKTIPQMVGSTRTKWLGIIVVMGSLGLQWWLVPSDQAFQYGLIWGSLLLILGLWRSTKKQSRYFASFWIESIPILWYVFLFVLSVLSNG